MTNLLKARASKWKRAQTECLKAMIDFGTEQAKHHMHTMDDPGDMFNTKKKETIEFWEAVARFVREMTRVRAEHPATEEDIDGCFATRAAQILIDGIGVNYRILHFSAKDFKTIHDMYTSIGPYVSSGPRATLHGPWWYESFSGWVPGGWEYAIR